MLAACLKKPESATIADGSAGSHSRRQPRPTGVLGVPPPLRRQGDLGQQRVRVEEPVRAQDRASVVGPVPAMALGRAIRRRRTPCWRTLGRAGSSTARPPPSASPRVRRAAGSNVASTTERGRRAALLRTTPIFPTENTA